MEILFKANLSLFDVSWNGINRTTDTAATTGNELSHEMKTYYSDYLIDLAEPELVHDRFAQKKPIPKNGGKVIEFRKYDSLPKAMQPLTEGVTPQGQQLNTSIITAEIAQYGGFIELSDTLLLTAIDNNLVQATRVLASQAGRTLDSINREVLVAGTNVQRAGGATSRQTITGKLTVEEIRKAVRTLKKFNAPKIDGYYCAIINPDCAYDLMSDPQWQYPHQYVDTKNIYDGEIGAIAGVRFFESTEAKIFGAGTAENANANDVYATLVMGSDAYGVTDVNGGGLQHIVKQLGSAGTADPLNQRATVGWKAYKTAEILVQQYMVRIESVSSFSDTGSN